MFYFFLLFTIYAQYIQLSKYAMTTAHKVSAAKKSAGMATTNIF